MLFVFEELPEFFKVLWLFPDPETDPPVALPPCEFEFDVLLPPNALALEVAFEFDEEVEVEFETAEEFCVCD